MAVQKIEKYRQKDGADVIKVWVSKPRGKYFYTDAKFIDLVQAHDWYIKKEKGNYYVKADFKTNETKYLHDIVARSVATDVDADNKDIVFLNGVTTDIMFSNLRLVDKKPAGVFSLDSLDYRPNKGGSPFEVYAKEGDKIQYQGTFRNELEALNAICKINWQHRNNIAHQFLTEMSKEPELLDDFRTGKIGSQELMLIKAIKYCSDNPWYAYRYGLVDVCRSYNIGIPPFTIDERGFMVDLMGCKLRPN